MDIGLALGFLSPDPTEVHEEHVVCQTALASLPLAIAMLDDETRQLWLRDHPDTPLAVRIELNLAAGRQAQAWRLCKSLRGGLDADPLVTGVLADWSRRRLGAADIRSVRGPVLLISDRDGAALAVARKETSGALRDVQLFTAALPWPFWQGPLVVVDDHRSWDDLGKGETAVIRPALPIIRVADPETLREDSAAAIMAIILERMRPPAGSWPAWFSIGMQAVARAKARGEGPSPRGMLARRQQAGGAAIAAMLRASDAEAVDAGLAEAVCAPLVHTRRRHRLASFMDLLRNGAAGLKAIEIAYELDLDDLLSQR